MQRPWDLWWIPLVLVVLMSGACGKRERKAPGQSPPSSPAGEWRTWNFDQAPIGQLPAGLSIQKTGRGTLPKWAVPADPTAPSEANVLAQRSKENSGEDSNNLAVIEDSDYQDLAREVKFKRCKEKRIKGAA